MSSGLVYVEVTAGAPGLSALGTSAVPDLVYRTAVMTNLTRRVLRS